VISYRLSQAAGSDLAAIFWQGLEYFGPVQTERYLGELEDVFNLLCRFPDIGRRRDELADVIRMYPPGAHVILYEINDEGVLIIRVRAARENWTADVMETGQNNG